MKKPPKQTAHDWCHCCIQSRMDEDVKNCGGELVYATGKPCPFFPYRMGTKRISVRVFRAFCLECMGGSPLLVAECENEECPIYPYRFGKNPARVGMCGNVSNFAGKPPLKVGVEA